MKRFCWFLRATLVWTLSVLALTYAAAQPGSANETNVSAVRAPDWLVWRVFHDSLDFYDRQSPDVVSHLLDERLGLTVAETSIFMTAGQTYLQQLRAIDDETRAELVARYDAAAKPKALPPSATKPVELLRPGTRETARPLVGGQTPDGRNIREQLEADGLIDRVLARRQAALQLHIGVVQQSFGSDRLSKIEQWIRAEVTPSVAVVPDAATPKPRGDLTPPSPDSQNQQSR